MQLVLPVKKGKAPTEFSPGQTGFSPDGKTFLAICENTYSSGTPLRCPLDIFAPALPPFPASRYAELVSGGHLPTISVRGWTAPSLYVFPQLPMAAFSYYASAKYSDRR